MIRNSIFTDFVPLLSWPAAASNCSEDWGSVDRRTIDLSVVIAVRIEDSMGIKIGLLEWVEILVNLLVRNK